MRKKLLTGLIMSVASVCAFVACQKDTPEIVIPELETTIACLSDLNPTVNQGDSMTVTLRTYPDDLLGKSSVSLSVVNADSTDYKYITLSSMFQNNDGTWALNFQFMHGVKDGDIIRIAVYSEHDAKTYYTPEIIIRYIKELKGIETLEQDTVSVMEGGDSLKIRIATLPWNLLSRNNVKISVLDGRDSLYRYATPLASTMLEDSTWTVNLRPEMGLETGDSIRICLTDPDTALYTKPLVVKLIRVSPKYTRSVEIVSNDIAAYYTGSMAKVRVRTTPWDLLIGNDSIRIVMVGKNGESLDETANWVVAKEIGRDSTWTVEMDLKSVYSNATVRASMVTSDSTYLSERTVNVKKVSFSLDGVQEGRSTKYSLDSKTMTYSRSYPTITNFKDIELTFSSSNGDRITFDGQDIAFKDKKCTGTADLSKPLTVTVWKYDASKEYTVILKNSGLPVIRITTPRSVNSKENWVSDCRMEIYYADGTLNMQDTLSMRCRGNASFKDTNKKSYALKIDEKQKILGMHKNKRWCLLANFKDRTLLRNDVTFWLARKTCQDYVISGQYVELVINGEYRGNYYFCEQGKIGKHRINIADADPANPAASGYLLESDAYYSQESHPQYGGFISNTMKIPYAFKEPDDTEMTAGALNTVKNFIEAFEACLKDETRVKNHEYEKYLDVDQCIDYGLVQELTGNLDFYNTYPVSGTHSMYFHIDSIGFGGKLKFGHLWDFDYQTYEPSRASGWVAMKQHGTLIGWDWNKGGQFSEPAEFYYYYLLKDPKFKNRMVERWNLLKADFKLATNYIDMMADSIRVSENFNATLPNNGDGGSGWFPIVNKNGGGANSDQDMSFQSAINQMKQAFLARWDWIDKNIGKL